MGLTVAHRLIQVKIQKARKYYKKFGLWRLVLLLFSRIGIIIKREYIFSEINLQDFNLHGKNNSILDLDFVCINKNNFEHFNFPSEEGWLTKDEALRRLTERNNIPFALTKGNKIVSYIWSELTMAHIPFLGLLVSIPDKTVYSLGMYTVPEFRRKGLASKIKLLQLQFLKNMVIRENFL